MSDAANNAAVQVNRTISVNNAPDNTPPVIVLNGANPQELTVGDDYTELGATASDNVDGDITGSIVIDASSVNTSVAGNYTVTYNVSDAANNAAVQVNRTISINNAPLNANAGLDRTLDSSSVNLNGTQSSGGVAPLSYQWSLLSRSPGASIPTITNATSAIPTVSNMNNVGDYTFELEVTDNVGTTDTDTVRITRIISTECPDPNNPLCCDDGIDCQ